MKIGGTKCALRGNSPCTENELNPVPAFIKKMLWSKWFFWYESSSDQKKFFEVYDAFSDFEEEIIETKSPDNSFEWYKGWK